jgi:16S rRNA (cytosine967-C5)-methyltransferase
VAAAIDCLNVIAGGQPAEQTLTNWARKNRYAGSKDRAAVRDHVYEALRRRRSFAALGGAETGRGLMIGALRADGADLSAYFSGEGYAPKPLDADELAHGPREMSEGETFDCQDWCLPLLQRSLGDDFAPVMTALQSRAPVFLRVNLRATDVTGARASLAGDGITSEPHALSPTALLVTDGARKIRASAAYTTGLVELQDVASQAIVDALRPLPEDGRVLDYCAGGGGKSLAMAAISDAAFFAHDVAQGRMADLPMRATRAGADVICLETSDLEASGPFDLIFVDAPCSGSGAWRRHPEAKWTLTEARLAMLVDIQMKIMLQASELLSETGTLAYATCSLLDVENDLQTRAFLTQKPEWSLVRSRRLTPLDGGDGFYISIFTRK